MQISMAVREAAVNAVLHGNAYAPEKKVTLAFERTGGDLIITIRDQGKGMDLSKIPNPLAPENLLKTSRPRNFSYALVYGCGGDSPLPDGH